MKLHVINQDNENECGICVLTALQNFFYQEEKLSKLDLYNILNYDGDKISIYDLEILASKIGLELESYKLEFDTFKKIENNTLFVTCLLNEDGYHYVICNKTNNTITIYDSCSEIKKYTYEEFKNIFTGIYISIKKKVINDNQCLHSTNKNQFNLPNMYFFIFMFIFVDLISTILCVIGNSFIKIIIDKVVPLELISELFYFSIFFISTYIFNFLINYVINIIKIKKYESIFKENILIYARIINYKNLDYFDKCSKEIIYEHPIAISKLIMHKYFDIPGLISDLITFVILFSIIFFTSYLFIIPIFINLIFIVIFGFIKLKNNNDNYHYLHINKNKIEINFSNFYNFLLNEKNNSKLNIVKENWLEELWSYQRINRINTKFNLTIDLFDNSVTKFIFVIFISICSYLIIIKFDNNLSISNMIFLTSILNMITTCINDIFNYWCSIPFYKKSKKILNDFLNIGNLNFKKGVKINSVEKIKINNLNFNYGKNCIFKNFNITINNGDLIIGKNGCGKTTLFKILSLSYLDKIDNQIIINNLPINCLDQKCLFDNIIYLPSDACLVSKDFTKIMNSDLETKDIATKLIKSVNLNLSNKDFSKGEKQVLNLISILHLKNKLILLDESFSNINNKLDNVIYGEVKNHLEKDNFVLWISHNKKCYKYFKNRIEINGK